MSCRPNWPVPPFFPILVGKNFEALLARQFVAAFLPVVRDIYVDGSCSDASDSGAGGAGCAGASDYAPLERRISRPNLPRSLSIAARVPSFLVTPTTRPMLLATATPPSVPKAIV